MGDETRRRRSRWQASVLAVCLAMTAAGCGTLIRLGGLAPGGSDPQLEESASRRRSLDALIERVADPSLEPSGDVVLRLSLTGGWGLPDPGDLHLTVQDDGRVIRVTATTVFSSTRDYTTMRLDREGIVRLLRLTEPLLDARREDLDGGGGVSPTDRSAWLDVGDALVFSMDRIGQTDGYTAERRARRAEFARVLDRLEDLTWLGPSILEPASPWVPSSMTVLARPVSPRSGLGPDTRFARWPLARSIEELAVDTALDPYGEEQLVLCLTGVQVGPVFALLTGVNHAYLPVDDGTRWELDVRPHYPGYQLVGDPCGDDVIRVDIDPVEPTRVPSLAWGPHPGTSGSSTVGRGTGHALITRSGSSSR